jgi:hypothetical protein
VNVFFDSCTPRVLATTLDGFIRDSGHRAFHIIDMPGLPKGRHSTDLEWIRYLQADREDWIFVTGDQRVLRNPPERAALRSAGLHGFVLAPAYQKTPQNQVAATIVWKWPEIEAIPRYIAPPSIHEIPIGRGSRLRQLPL